VPVGWVPDQFVEIRNQLRNLRPRFTAQLRGGGKLRHLAERIARGNQMLMRTLGVDLGGTSGWRLRRGRRLLRRRRIGF
jgi:hypothetical protein